MRRKFSLGVGRYNLCNIFIFLSDFFYIRDTKMPALLSKWNIVSVTFMVADSMQQKRSLWCTLQHFPLLSQSLLQCFRSVDPSPESNPLTKTRVEVGMLVDHRVVARRSVHIDEGRSERGKETWMDDNKSWLVCAAEKYRPSYNWHLKCMKSSTVQVRLCDACLFSWNVFPARSIRHPRTTINS